MKLAFVFPGQGSQKVGMADWAKESEAAAAVMQAADRALGEPLGELIANGPDTELNLTVNTQPALLATSYAVFAAWKEAGGPMPEVMAGHSLGEYTALTAAGVFSIEDAVRLVRFRASAMQSAVPVGVGGMAAILGLSDDVVIDLCAKAAQDEAVEAVNFNCPGQVVIAGAVNPVNKAIEALKAAGAKRAVLLPVSAPFHSTLMQPAAARLAEVLAPIEIKDITVPVVANVTAQEVTSGEEIKKLLVKQAAMPVLWETSVRNMVAGGVDIFVEVGPGKVLTGFTKKIAKGMMALNVEDAASLEKTLAELNK